MHTFVMQQNILIWNDKLLGWIQPAFLLHLGEFLPLLQLSFHWEMLKILGFTMRFLDVMGTWCLRFIKLWCNGDVGLVCISQALESGRDKQGLPTIRSLNMLHQIIHCSCAQAAEVVGAGKAVCRPNCLNWAASCHQISYLFSRGKDEQKSDRECLTLLTPIFKKCSSTSHPTTFPLWDSRYIFTF